MFLNVLKFICFFTLFAQVGCNDSKFSGGSDRKDDGGNDPNGEDVEVDSRCDETQSKTEAELLTKSVKRNQANQFIKYQLTLLNCKGEGISLDNKDILFDIDGNVGTFSDLNFRISSNDAPDSFKEGVFAHIDGSDLFGNKDVPGSLDRYSHWRINGFEYSDSATKVFLEIDVSNRSVVNRVNESDPSIPSFIRIGESLFVKKDVIWQ